MSIAHLLELPRGVSRDCCCWARSRGNEHRSRKRAVVSELGNLNFECKIDEAALNSAITENEGTSLPKLEQIHNRSEPVSLASGFASVLNSGFAIVVTVLLAPGNTVSLADHPIIRERIHLFATVVLQALALKSEIMIASAIIRTPDNRPFMTLKQARHAIELAIPAPEVIVITVDSILRGSKLSATRENASESHQLK